MTTAREQRFWLHKTANVLDEMPKGRQSEALGMLHDIWIAANKDEAEQVLDLFIETYQAKHP